MLRETTFPETWPGHEVYRMLLETLGSSGLLLAAFIVCAAIASIAVLSIWRNNRKKVSKCPWKRDRDQSNTAMTRWVCSKCKGISFSNDNEPPVTCRAYEPRSKSL